MWFQCQRCQKEFKAKPSQKSKYCSRRCWNKVNEEKRTNVCTYCKKEYQIPKEGKQPRGRPFCGRKCWDAFQIGENNPGWKGGKINKKCANCSKDFLVKISDSDLKCCSHKCRGENMQGDKNPHFHLNAYLTCEFCSKHFRRTKGHRYKRNFCSKECASRAHSQYIAGQNNGRYIHGEAIRAYPPGWTQTFKEEIRNRDRYECRLCYRQQTAHIGKLHVHHIDYDKDNLSPDNLITLCKFCHGKMHGGIKEREAWKEKLLDLLKGEYRHSLSTT